MAKFGIKTSSPQDNGVDPTEKKCGKCWFKENQRSILAVALIALIAFALRFVFAYSTSASSGFALSDGANHLHNITQILAGNIPFGVDYSMNYPYGAVNTDPLLTDLFLTQFALIGTAAGMTNVEAASAALAWSGVIFGTLSCITMYYVAKEFFNSKKAGYLAALFLAFCPIVIQQTVFSNGSTIAVIEFLFLIALLLLMRGIRAVDTQAATASVKEIFTQNKTAMIYAALVGVVIGLIALSWNNFRSIIVLMIFLMAIQALIDRFRGKDVRVFVLFYTIAIAVPMIIATAYYIPACLWDAVLSGVLLAAIIAVAVCLIFAFTQKAPWTLTIPVLVIALIAVFVALFFLAPDYFNVIVNGNSTYAASISTLIGPSGLSISALATGFGAATMWFGLIMICVMFWRLPKNIASPFYVFTLVFMCFCSYFALRDEKFATVFSPAFAFGFAWVILWIFEHVDFKTYFTSFKSADYKTIWKKIVKPMPFITILAIAILICVPNAVYAVDAGVPSNDKSDYEGFGLGATSYYIKTSDDWKMNDVLSTYSNVAKSGALVTWVDYADDAASFGNFSTIVDENGYGAIAASNILLADATDGSSTAAMLIYFMNYYGVENCRNLLVGHGLTEEQFNQLKDVLSLNHASDYKNTVLTNTTKYGRLDSSISDENVAFIYAKEFITDNCTVYTISSMYESVASACSKNISYFMIGSGMFPVYYGYNTTFASLAKINGYSIDDDYGTVSEFEVANYYTLYYTGVYSYTDSMYNSLLWRAYVGMSPAEAGFGSTMMSSYQYISALSLSDGTTKAVYGYGLANYEADYGHIYVDYNANMDATVSSDGWTKMLYKEAVEKQEKEGGLINYLAGYPVVMKYKSNSTGTAVSGTVVDSLDAGVAGVRVTVIDSEGVKRSTDYTDKNGKFTVLANGNNYTIEVVAASTSLTDGSLIKTYKYGDDVSKTVIPNTSIDGRFVNSDGDKAVSGPAIMTLVGQNSEKTYTFSTEGTSPAIDITDMTFSTGLVVPDIYSITVTSLDSKYTYATTTYTTSIGQNIGLNVEFTTYTISVTVKTEAKAQVADGTEVSLVSIDSDGVSEAFSAVTEDGVAKVNVYEGTYEYKVKNGAKVYATSADALTVSSSGSKSVTINVCEAETVAITGIPAGNVATVYSDNYVQSVVTTSATDVIVPVGTVDGAFFSVYSLVYDDGASKNKVYWSVLGSALSPEDCYAISGKLKLASDTVCTGTLRIIDTEHGNREITLKAGSDGSFKTYLPTGKYIVYAIAGTESIITDLEVGTEAKSDVTVTTAAAINVLGYVYWTSTSYCIAYAPVSVSNIAGHDGLTVKFMTTLDGKYDMYIPADSKCSVTVTADPAKPYYFGSADAKEYTKTENDVMSAQNFTMYADKLSVKNDLTYKISVGSKEIEAGATELVSITSPSIYVKIDTTDGAGVYMYLYENMYQMPTKDTVEIKSDDYTPVSYYKVEIKSLAETDNVNIKALDEDYDETKTIASTGTERSWYLEKEGSFLITITNTDSSKMMYKTIDMTQNYTDGNAITADLKDVFSVSGYTGVAKNGSLTVDYSAELLEFDITSGRYDIKLPLIAGDSYELSALMYEEDEYDYSSITPVVISANNVKAGDKLVYNFAAEGGLLTEPDDVTVDISTITAMDDMPATDKLINIEFEFTLTRSGSPTDSKTYLLAAGSDWTTLLFYNGTQQITSYTVNGATSGTITAKGTVMSSLAALQSENLTVIVNDINGEEAGVGMFPAWTTGAGHGWKFSTPSETTTVIEYGVDKVGDSEYNYAITIVNKDNFTKYFTVDVKADVKAQLEQKWFITYEYGDNIYANGNNVAVDGNSDLTVYVKITAKNSISDLSLGDIKVIVTSNDANIKMSTDATEGITVAGDKLSAEVTSKPMDSAITISSASADGRGVVNVKSDLPAYIWLIVALIIIMAVLLTWASLRRGVFSRKK